MQIIEAIADANVLDTGGQETYTLQAGSQYVVYDSEAAHGLRAGAVKLVTTLDRVLPVYRRGPLAGGRLILPFIGRHGDAVVVASCIAALLERYPGSTVDIAGPKPTCKVLRLMPRFGKLLPYPLPADRLSDYRYHLSFEDVEAVPDGGRRSCADVFSSCLHTPRPSRPPRVTVPLQVRARWTWPSSDRPRVAVQVGKQDNLRSYPPDLLGELTSRLVDDGFEAYLVGVGGTGGCPIALAVGEANNGESESPTFKKVGHPTYVHDLVGQTPSPADLAAVLAQMQAVVTGDSFPMHLAGALGVPTIAMFTTTDAVIGSDYPSVVTIQSGASCSPCRIAEGQCPLGHRTCVAHHAPALSPERIVEHVRLACGIAGPA